jgi:hypothetical protein
MNHSTSSALSKDQGLLTRLFHYDEQRALWTYPHDDQVFKVMAACAKLNLPCRNVPKDDPNAVEIEDTDWRRVFPLPLTSSQDESLSPPSSASNEVPMKKHTYHPKKHAEDHEETSVRYYQFHRDDHEESPQEILKAAESEIFDEEDDQDMETAVHALAERTEAVVILKEESEDLQILPAPAPLEKKPETSLLAPPHVSQNSKESTMTTHEKHTVKNDSAEKAPKNKDFSELSSWEQVLEDRESTLAAREKVLRMRQNDVQDMEERFHEERKVFNADYEEKKAFLEDKEQRLKKIFERIEEVAYEFRRNTRVEDEVS